MTIEQKLKEAEKIPGLKKHLDYVSKYHGVDWTMNGSAQLLDLQLKPEEKAAAYIVGEHEWNDLGYGGIEYAVRIGAFRKGESEDSGKIVYRDMLHAYKDDWSKAYKKIKSFDVEKDKVKIKVASSEAEKEFIFNI